MSDRDLRRHLKTTGSFLLEMIVYSAVVVAYYFFVLLLLRNWLKHLFDDHRAAYAAVVLPLIIGQAVLLDAVTIGLRKLGWRKPE